MPGETTTTDTEAATTETNTTNNVPSTNRQQVQNRGNINRNNNITIVNTEDKNYEVYTPKVGGLISLRT